ncbi:MAG: tubulin-like doman-containing protein [Chloroflexota bacterium]|nr:tubulin-like doman-containing protein [Chloroflexota bacterium]
MNEPVQRYDKPTIYPTMVVGVGGMGSNTVRAVKRRFRNVWGGEQLPGMIQLLALDTEPLVNRLDQEPLFADEFAYMGKFDATRLVSNLDQHPEIAQWWNYPSIPLGYIHNGAKQLRPIGRLCFFRNYVNFKQLLETKLTNLDKIRDMEIAQNRGFPVVGNFQLIYVVSSLCGGTGAGMFLDVVHRIRAQVRNNARIVGIFFLPDVLENEISSDLQRRRIRANAYAALKEMNHFQETQQFRALYPSEQRELPDTPYAPFDFIFLMGRTNRDGRSLARKSDAENMAAHLIQLTAISHLSSEILGLEVNVVRERMFELEGAAGHVTGERISRRRHFLVYSSFAASALVAPHESLVDFWQRAFVADLIRRFAAGPSLSDPRQPLPEADRQRVQNLWQTLLSHLAGRFAALDNDRLDADLEQVEEMQGAWLGFWEPIRQTMQRALMDTGIRGAIALCDLLSPPAAATALPESLARQRLFLVDGAPVTEEDRLQWRKLLAQQGGFAEQAQQLAGGLGELAMMALSPRQARERARDLAARKARARIYQKRDALEVAIVDQIGKQANILRQALRSQINACAMALARANQDAGRMADRIDPRIPDGRPSTSTYYELETGAVGRDYLQHFYRRAASAVSATDWHNALAPLFTQLLQDANAVSADDIYAQLNAATADNTGLLHRVHSMVDINHIITVQHGEEVERSRQRPDNRIHQWLDRLNPYIRWDADRFSFHESNLEHIRLAAVPTSRQEDSSLLAATVGQEDIKWVPTGDHMRMDAVWIVHGLPVTLLERLDEFRAQYENSLDFPVREEFHLNPAWADLPEITPEQGDRTPSPSLVPRPDAVPRRTFN